GEAALVLATQEFVANGGGRPSDRRRRSAASPGRTGSRGRGSRRGCWRSKPAAREDKSGLTTRLVSAELQKPRATRLWLRPQRSRLTRDEHGLGTPEQAALGSRVMA